MKTPFHVEFTEDSTAEVLGRWTARNGSGAATGVDGEGNWLQQADLSEILCNIYDIDSDPDTAHLSPTVTIGNVILDTPVTTSVIWTVDTTGYNFIHELPITAFPTGGNRYVVEYKATLTGGGVFFAQYKGRARKVRVS